jgi:hypothetical protein
VVEYIEQHGLYQDGDAQSVASAPASDKNAGTKEEGAVQKGKDAGTEAMRASDLFGTAKMSSPSTSAQPQ